MKLPLLTMLISVNFKTYTAMLRKKSVYQQHAPEPGDAKALSSARDIPYLCDFEVSCHLRYYSAVKSDWAQEKAAMHSVKSAGAHRSSQLAPTAALLLTK